MKPTEISAGQFEVVPISDIDTLDTETRGDAAGNKVLSPAGGYTKQGDIYYIEELAVEPGQQGNGYGRSTLELCLTPIRQTLPADLRSEPLPQTIRPSRYISEKALYKKTVLK